MNRHADGEYPLGAPMGTVGGPRYSEGLEAGASLTPLEKKLLGLIQKKYSPHGYLRAEAFDIAVENGMAFDRKVMQAFSGLEAKGYIHPIVGGMIRLKTAGRKGLKDLDPRKWYISTEDGDTYGPYSNQSQAGDDGDAAFRGTTDFVVERGDKVRDSVLDPKNFGLFSPRELMKSADQKLARQWFGKTAATPKVWATFIPQMNDGKRIVPDRKSKPYKFDISKQLLSMGYAKGSKLESDTEDTDRLWEDNPISRKKPHDGPFAVRIDEFEIEDFFNDMGKTASDPVDPLVNTLDRIPGVDECYITDKKQMSTCMTASVLERVGMFGKFDPSVFGLPEPAPPTPEEAAFDKALRGLESKIGMGSIVSAFRYLKPAGESALRKAGADPVALKIYGGAKGWSVELPTVTSASTAKNLGKKLRSNLWGMRSPKMKGGALADLHDRDLFVVYSGGVERVSPMGKTAEDMVDPAKGELGKRWFKTDEAEDGEADSGSEGAADLFFDNPLTRETREFAQAKTPPEPSEIRDKEPGGEAFSTLNRLVVETDHPTDAKMPEGFDDVEKSEQVLKQAWFGKTAASTADTAQGRLDDLCLGICTMGMAKDTPLLGKPTHDHSYGPAGARVEAIWKGRPYELVAYFHSSGGKLSGSCTAVFAESGDSDSFDWSGSNQIKDIAKRARQMIDKLGSKQP